MSRKTETRVESKLEYKNDHSNAENQATSQIKNVVNDINKVVENMNKLTNNNKLMNSESCNSESTNGQSDDGKRTEKNESSKSKDEIPLIDDGVEESKQTRLNCDEMQNDNQMQHHHSSIDQTTHTGCALQSNSFTPSYAPYDTQLSNSSTHPQSNQAVGGLDQAMSTFENIKLTEDESIESVQTTDLCQLDSVDLNPDEQEEKERLIQQLLELRNTLDDLSNRVSSVREMSFKLTNENNVLNQYVENLMSASSVFQSTATTNSANAKRRQRK